MKASDGNPINHGISDNTVMSANAIVVVNVEDVNEFTPKFEHSNYKVNIPESLKIGEKVLQLKAADEDCEVKYFLLILLLLSPDTLYKM